MNENDFHFITVGSRQNPLLIFLHGFLGDAQDWYEVFTYLESEFYCVALDLPGHGKTTVDPLAGKNSIRQTAADIASFITVNKFDTACLIGYSLGGRISLQLAVDFPMIPKRLVIESATPGIEDERQRAKRLQADIRLARRLENEPPEDFFDFWYSQLIFNTLRNKSNFGRLLEKRKQINPANAAQSLRAMSQGRQAPLWDKVDGLKMPVLLVGGGLDEKYKPLLSRAAELIPHCRLEIHNGRGHNVHFEDPAAFSAAIRRFLIPRKE